MRPRRSAPPRTGTGGYGIRPYDFVFDQREKTPPHLLFFILRNGGAAYPMIPQEYIQEVVRRNDIEEVIGQYVQLRRRGRTATGLCPFHNEKTPSFVVYPDTQSFYCFGCGAAGDVINFVRKYNNLGYVEAVKQLAGRAGMPLPEEDDRESRARQAPVGDQPLRRALLLREPQRQKRRRPPWPAATGRKSVACPTPPSAGSALATHRRTSAACCTTSSAADSVRRSWKPPASSSAAPRATSMTSSATASWCPSLMCAGPSLPSAGACWMTRKPKYINSPETMVYHKSRTLFALNIAEKVKKPALHSL